MSGGDDGAIKVYRNEAPDVQEIIHSEKINAIEFVGDDVLVLGLKGLFVYRGG